MDLATVLGSFFVTVFCDFATILETVLVQVFLHEICLTIPKECGCPVHRAGNRFHGTILMKVPLYRSYFLTKAKTILDPNLAEVLESVGLLY